jgi:hypothetical protein
VSDESTKVEASNLKTQWLKEAFTWKRMRNSCQNEISSQDEWNTKFRRTLFLT